MRKHSQSRVLPSAELAYETGLSAGSIAVLADGHQIGALTRNCTELTRLPSECITGNALRALKLVGARRVDFPSLANQFPRMRRFASRTAKHVQGCLILSQVGLLFPVNHASIKMVSLTGFAPAIFCMRGRHID